MRGMLTAILLGISLGLPHVNSDGSIPCDVRARTETGWVCGLRRWSENGKIYASFRGVPYAKQPVGKLRFKELEPHEPWEHDFDARYEGPVCPQHDQTYELLSKPDFGMSEACIHANIHVPLHALPGTDKGDETENSVETSKYEYENIYEKNPLYHYDEKSGNSFKDPLQKHENNKEHKKDKHGEKNHVQDFSEHHLKDELKYIHDMTKLHNYAEFNPSLIFSQHNDNEEKDIEKTFVNSSPKERHEDPKSQFFELLTFLEKSHENTKGFMYDEPQKNIKNDKNMPLNTWHYQHEYDTDKPIYFRPNIENYNTDGKGIDYILKTWPQFHRKETEYSRSDHRNKRHVNKDIKDANPKYEKKLLPVLVFIHGGGFYAGSGDADLHGPEYLVSKDVIVITFNYRINVFGFLSLNSSSVPGNAGVRDQITLLRWVQKNAKSFGGDPENVTLMGQSAGATMVHLLTLSDAAKGLFKRVLLLSGTAYQAFYTTSPIYAAAVRASFLAYLGITTVDPEEIHHILIHMPLKRILEANSLLQEQYGMVVFSPVVESRFPGVTTVVDKEPEISIAEGRGKDYPLVVGYTTAEAETFRTRFGYNRYPARVIANPRNLLPARIPFTAPSNVSLALGEKMKHRCFEDKPDVDGVVKCYTETFFVYQAFRLARERAHMDAAPTYLYQFSYLSDLNLIQEGLKLKYKGVAHIEDLTFIFRVNSLLEPRNDFPPQNRDDMMKDWMTSFVVNFMHCSDPTCNKISHKTGWPQVTREHLVYEDIEVPYEYKVRTPTHELLDMIRFYDKIYKLSQNGVISETLNKEN